jgi:hypothetical protein
METTDSKVWGIMPVHGDEKEIPFKETFEGMHTNMQLEKYQDIMMLILERYPAMPAEDAKPLAQHFMMLGDLDKIRNEIINLIRLLAQAKIV